jgi:hypothetical protein
MSRCLRERTLWGIYEGEGTAAQQAHLQACVACHVRYQAFVHTLEEISSSLQETPPPPARMPRPFPSPVRWQSAVVGLAVLLLLVGGSLWLRQVPPPMLPAVVYSEELTALLEEVDIIVVMTLDVDSVESWEAIAEVDALDAALEEE